MILIQASSTSWSGGPDVCLARIDGVTLLQLTIEECQRNFDVPIAIIAPERDAGKLDSIADFCGCEVIYSHDTNVLARMASAVADLPDDAPVLRIDGTNAFFDSALARYMLDLARRHSLVKMPDDFPPQLCGDAWLVGAIRELAASPIRLEYLSRPKFAVQNAFIVERWAIDDGYLKEVRRQMQSATLPDHIAVTNKAVPSADQISFHYQLANLYLDKGSRVLDIACGEGYGANILKSAGHMVYGADLDDEKLARAAAKSLGAFFCRQDIYNISWDDGSFDAVTCMETIEHLSDPRRALSELRRMLKPGGKAVLSTPQNSHGHIPICPHHEIEHSLEGIKSLCAEFFTIERVIGLKSGTVYFEGDPVGTNTVLFMRAR